MKNVGIFLFCAALAAPALAADDTPSPLASPPATQLVGFVSPLQGTGICKDGATHLIHAAQGDFRLKAASPQVAKALTAVAKGQTRVSLSGHRVNGPECVVFTVARVDRMSGD